MSLSAFERLSTAGRLAGLVVAATFATILYKGYRTASNTHSVSLPPGPPARWFWQSALPAVNIAHTIEEWIAEYGPVITLRQGSQVVVVIGRVDAAWEIMEKEGGALADRPHSIAAGELLSKGLRLLLIGSGERFRRFRKILHTHLQPRAIIAYQDLQLEQAKDAIVDILNDPKNHRMHAQRYAASVILRLAYGKSAPTAADDPEVVRVQQSTRNLQGALRPGSFLVDQIPLLKHIPRCVNQLNEYHNFEIQLFRDQMKRVQSEMETNTAGDSFMKTLLEQVQEHKLSKDEMAYLAGNLFGAGSETTAIGITNIILAAACHPEAQRRVQEGLDTVVGKDRLPTWQDSELLPQVHAFILEVLRWRPIAPIGAGFSHRATQDIVWRGQCIPAGATVIGCFWAISRDPVVFPDPEKLDPRRWIDDRCQLRHDAASSFPYGFGRRICPGRHLADNSLYINCALLLWSFRIAEKPGKPIDVNAYSDAVVSHSAHFEVDFIPRMEEGQLREMISEPMI